MEYYFKETFNDPRSTKSKVLKENSNSYSINTNTKNKFLPTITKRKKHNISREKEKEKDLRKTNEKITKNNYLTHHNNLTENKDSLKEKSFEKELLTSPTKNKKFFNTKLEENNSLTLTKTKINDNSDNIFIQNGENIEGQKLQNLTMDKNTKYYLVNYN